MLLDPYQLRTNLNRLEEIEKASLRLVVQAIYDYRNLGQQTATTIFVKYNYEEDEFEWSE